MSPVNTRTALQHVVLGLVLVAITILITVCFNILGTFACSILTGLMLGACRQWKWHIILVSLLFPAAMLGLLEFSKGDILPRIRIILSVLCWGGFVITYLLSYLLVYFERPAQAPPPPAPSQVVESDESSSAEVLPEPVSAPAPARLTLETLQGEWSSEPLLKQEAAKKILQVAGDELVLSVIDANGQITTQTKGHLRLE